MKKFLILLFFFTQATYTMSGAQSADDDEEVTRFLKASIQGDLATVQTMLSQNSALVCTEHNGRKPLHAAAYAGCAEVVRALLDNGAIADDTDGNGNTALHLVFPGRFDFMMRVLCGTGLVRRIDGAVEPIQRGHGYFKETIQLLVERGASVDKQNNEGEDCFAVSAKQISRALELENFLREEIRKRNSHAAS